jgi:hypothetical protein
MLEPAIGDWPDNYVQRFGPKDIPIPMAALWAGTGAPWDEALSGLHRRSTWPLRRVGRLPTKVPGGSTRTAESRILADGAIAPGCQTVASQSARRVAHRFRRVVGDGTGGAYVVWNDFYIHLRRIFVQRVLQVGQSGATDRAITPVRGRHLRRRLWARARTTIAAPSGHGPHGPLRNIYGADRFPTETLLAPNTFRLCLPGDAVRACSRRHQRCIGGVDRHRVAGAKFHLQSARRRQLRRWPVNARSSATSPAKGHPKLVADGTGGAYVS